MKAFALVFVCLAIYGLFTGHFGGALFSVGMGIFVIYGSRQLNKRDVEFYESPASADVPANTDSVDALHAMGTEASRVVL